MNTPDVRLRDEDLSGIYLAADSLAVSGQKRTKLLVRTELLSLVAAAVAGVGTLRVGEAQLDVFAATGALFFLVAIGSTATRTFTQPERDWYAGRAAAESVRTLAWRYALGGDPFPHTLDPDKVRERYLSRIQMVLAELREMELPPVTLNAGELTQAMEEVRGAELQVRREVYRRDRLGDQISWYIRRAGGHRRLARIWLAVTTAASVLGVIGAALKFLGFINFDPLGVAAACASAAIAWNQLNQHRMQVAAYVLTARELNIIKDRIDVVPDERWPIFVSDSEDAISREHVMWAARHGHPVVQRKPDDDGN